MLADKLPTAGKKTRSQLLGQMLLFMAVRLLFNTAHRMVYPFLPEFSRFFGVTPATISSVIAFRSLAGVTSPFLARFADSRGRRFGMLLGSLLFTAGLSLVVLWPRIEVFLIGLTLASLGKFTLDPSIQAFLGDEVPAERRGTAVAVVELGWSLSFFLGVSGVRILIEKFGTISPFQVMAFLGLAAYGGFLLLLPREDRRHESQASLWPRVVEILSNPNARAALLVGFVLSAANELVSITFALWLEQDFGMNLAALASAALVIGLSELFGESLVGTLTDRLGPARAVAIGTLLNCVFAAALPLIGRSPAGAYLGLFLFYLSFEFTVVSVLALMTMLPTGSRATFMGIGVAIISVGRMLTAWIALPIFALGLWGIVLGTMALNLLGLAGLRGVKLMGDEEAGAVLRDSL